MADSVILEQSLSDESSSPPDFVEKQILYVNDSNNSNYSSQIVIDTTSLSNSGSWLGWSESFLMIPVVLQMQAVAAAIPAADDATRSLDFAMALKSGYWNLIHSMSVEFNNSSVVQQTPYLNVFFLVSRRSLPGVVKMSPTTGKSLASAQIQRTPGFSTMRRMQRRITSRRLAPDSVTIAPQRVSRRR